MTRRFLARLVLLATSVAVFAGMYVGWVIGT